MVLIDSSVWVEYFRGGPAKKHIEQLLEVDEPLIISSLQIYELYKVLKKHDGEERALEAMVSLRDYELTSVDDTLALEAADIALEHNLAMADAIIYATAKSRHAKLLTKDTDFKDLPGVELIH